MNAEETLAKIRTRYDVTLPVLGAVTIRLPHIADCIIAGGIPLPALMHLEGAEGNGSGPSIEEMKHSARFNDEVVLRTLVAIGGEPVEMTLEAVAELDQQDYDALRGYGTRTTPVPTTAISPT
jgi:hypothetical protein